MPLRLTIGTRGSALARWQAGHEHLPPSPYEHHGQRVVEGQRLMQTVGDILLGWARSRNGNDYYWRQLHDWKGSPAVEREGPKYLLDYARLCGWTLARAHARSGDPVAIAAYLGKGKVFDEAVTRFAELYADQNDRDHQAFVREIRSGRLEAHT